MNDRPEQIGNYVIDREIGRGATSEVWLAHHAHLDHRLVAIKLLLTQDVETIQRFCREANMVSNLDHASIVKVLDHGRHQSFYYSVLEYIQGSSLQQLLTRIKRLDFPDAIAIFRQIASALDYAHTFHIIHRDVSPGNVLIEENTGRAVLTDFGIARDINKKITVNDKIMGTPGYWSPEHARSATEVTHLSDIYGLGVVLYVMLTGVLPWDDIPVTPDQPFGSLIPLKKHGLTNMPNDVDRVVQTMLAIDPTKRYPTAQAAIDELDRISKRHQATTQNYTKHAPTSTGTPIEVPQATAGFEAHGIQHNDVETALGPSLIRQPIVQAHQRAESLCQPGAIADILNRWSTQGWNHGVFRRAMLGRLARLHKVSSRNLYFFNLEVLYEERGEVEIIELADNTAEEYPLEPEADRWDVALPSVQGFTQDPGKQMVIPGSTKIVVCRTCKGKGKVVCPRCNGQRRIIQMREASDDTTPTSSSYRQTARTAQSGRAQQQQYTRYSSSMQNPSRTAPSASAIASSYTEEAVVPCPECAGLGGMHCEVCEGSGRLVQHKAFQWQRYPHTFTSHDHIPHIHEQWVSKNLEAVEIYHERVHGDRQSSATAFHAEWADIAEAQALIQQAIEATDANGRIIMSELRISMIPVTDIGVDLGTTRNAEQDQLQLTIYGFDNAVPDDWRLLNWERVIFFWLYTFMLALVVIFGYFAFTGP